jgi:hypothetical protein
MRENLDKDLLSEVLGHLVARKIPPHDPHDQWIQDFHNL